MKKMLLMLLAAALLLCACGQTAPASPQAAPAAQATPAALSPAAEELDALLGELRQTVQPGTAGSSLRAASMAAKLLDWAESAELTDEELLAVLSPWLGELDDGLPGDFPEQLAAVDGMARILTGEDAAQALGLLEDAGCEDCGYPWSGKAAAVLERLMTLAGLREAP